MNTQRAKELIDIIDKAKAELQSIFAGQAAVTNIAQPIPSAPLAAAPKAAAQAAPKPPQAAPKPGKKTRNMTPEGRERIAAAARLRWAKAKGQVPAEPTA